MQTPNLVLKRLKLNEEHYTETTCTNYRRYDEQFVHTKSYLHYGGILRELSSRFNHPIDVLDIGCGTGRYFHTLQNLNSLTGIDVSGAMLQHALNPLNGDAIAPEKIGLVQGNFYEYDFGEKSFDFVYSIGVLGEHTVFDSYVAAKLHHLLKENGKVFFTVVDLEPRKNLKRRLAESCYPLMPGKVKHIFDKRWETCYMTFQQLEEVMKKSPLSFYQIERYICEDPKWKGVHLDCVAHK